jgi:hypothetical protein
MESVLSICPIASAKRANRFTSDPRWTVIRTVATYRFWTGHALLLVKTRFLRPRNSRGEIAICPAKWPLPCPQPRSVRDQSATATVSTPRPVRDLDQSEAVTAAASADCPCSVRANGRKPSAASPQSRGVVRVNQLWHYVSPCGASIYCSPHPAALQIAPAARLRGFCLYDFAHGEIITTGMGLVADAEAVSPAKPRNTRRASWRVSGK